MADAGQPWRAPGLPLAEVGPSQATGAQKEIYAEIRHWSAVPFVALFYRHLAAHPGALEWAWQVLRPLMTRGLLQERAWQLAARADVPAAAPLPRAALRVAGIAAADESRIADVLDAYNRANPVNLVAVRCLARALDSKAFPADPVLEPLAWSPPAQVPPLPDMISPAAMSPAVRALAALLANRDDSEASALWPSLYRHLAHWPGFLGYAAVLVTPSFAAIDAAAARFGHEIDLVAGELSASPLFAAKVDRIRPELDEPMRAAIREFSTRIPEMVVIGKLLRRAMPTSSHSGSTAASP